jgi:hypothetical protein
MVWSASLIALRLGGKGRLEKVPGSEALRVMAMPSLWGSLSQNKLIRLSARKRERGRSRKKRQNGRDSPEFGVSCSQ